MMEKILILFYYINVGKQRLSGPLRLSLLSTTKFEGNIKPTLIIQGCQKNEKLSNHSFKSVITAKIAVATSPIREPQLNLKSLEILK